MQNLCVDDPGGVAGDGNRCLETAGFSCRIDVCISAARSPWARGDAADSDFILWLASPGFRQFVLSLNPKNLTIVQTGRIGGMTFVVLYVYGILPGVFALPAGWGDFAIGITAPFVAIYLGRQRRV